MTRIGLVLGSGGVLGAAHAGVIEVLRAERVRIDLVVGASVGAIFGLGVAAGIPTERLVELTRAANALDLFRFYAGRLRTDRRNPIARLVYDAGAGRTFDDLPLPFAVLATDIETGRPHVLRSGPLLPAIEASFALPFIARPVRIGGRLYLDGGLRDSTPISVAHEMGADLVAAVHLNTAAGSLTRGRPWVRTVAGRLGTQRRPLSGRIDDQVRFAMRMFADTLDLRPEQGRADVDIRPEFDGVTANSLKGIRYCYRQGKEAALRALPAMQDWPRVADREHVLFEDIP